MSGKDHDHHDHSDLSETQLRVRALETVLTQKGYVDPAALDEIVEAYETRIGPRNGAAVVARAWCDPAFKKALLADASKAVATLGHAARPRHHGDGPHYAASFNLSGDSTYGNGWILPVARLLVGGEAYSESGPQMTLNGG